MRMFVFCLCLAVPVASLAVPPVQLANGDGSAVPPVSSTLGLTVNTLPGTRWTCGLAGLAATLTQCQALVAGRTYYITDIVVGTTTTTAGDYAIQSGTGTNCATGTTVVFPSAPADAAARYKAPISSGPIGVIALRQPIPVTAAHAICVIGTAINTINVNLSGYYLP